MAFCVPKHCDRPMARRRHVPPKAPKKPDPEPVRATPETIEAARLRHHRRWNNAARENKIRQPLCADPFDVHRLRGEVAINHETHHIEPVALRPDLAYVQSNLMGLCRECHLKITKDERRRARA